MFHFIPDKRYPGRYPDQYVPADKTVWQCDCRGFRHHPGLHSALSAVPASTKKGQTIILAKILP